MKRPGHGEKGFTLLELLLVIAILILLATMVTPNLLRFIATGKVAAANTEVTSVESAALAYYSDHHKQFPLNTNTDLVGNDYLNEEATVDYTFDDNGKVIYQNGAAWGSHSNIIWNSTAHQWQSIWK